MKLLLLAFFLLWQNEDKPSPGEAHEPYCGEPGAKPEYHKIKEGACKPKGCVSHWRLVAFNPDIGYWECENDRKKRGKS